MNQTIETILNRNSIRKYTTEQIKDDELNLLIECASKAPSGHNCQPWHFTVIQNKKFIDNMSTKCKELMAKSGIDWVERMGTNERLHLFHKAPTIIVVSSNMDTYSPYADCSAAIENMMLAAWSMGIGSCWIGLTSFLFEIEEEVKKLNLPEGYKPLYTVTLGYPDPSREHKSPERNKDIVNYIK